LQATECGVITFEQINSIKLALKRHVKRKTGGKIIFRLYPYKLFTKKPKEVRMGKGKGTKVRYWGAEIKKGKILIELSDVLLSNARKFFHSVQVRLPINTRIFYSKILFFYGISWYVS